MLTSTSATDLARLLSELTARARQRGWSDRAWAQRAGVPNETLCRMRGRSATNDHCDFATLLALATAVGARFVVQEADLARARASADGLWPLAVDRALEAELLVLFAGPAVPAAADARSVAPAFFVAGLAVALASVPGFDRPGLLALAEVLHPGATELRVFERWLSGTPLKPDRFLRMLLASRGKTSVSSDAEALHAA